MVQFPKTFFTSLAGITRTQAGSTRQWLRSWRCWLRILNCIQYTTTNPEVERTWTDTTMAYLNAQSEHLPAGSETTSKAGGHNPQLLITKMRRQMLTTATTVSAIPEYFWTGWNSSECCYCQTDPKCQQRSHTGAWRHVQNCPRL